MQVLNLEDYHLDVRFIELAIICTSPFYTKRQFSYNYSSYPFNYIKVIKTITSKHLIS